jgi:hypothetical protein
MTEGHTQGEEEILQFIYVPIPANIPPHRAAAWITTGKFIAAAPPKIFAIQTPT